MGSYGSMGSYSCSGSYCSSSSQEVADTAMLGVLGNRKAFELVGERQGETGQTSRQSEAKELVTFNSPETPVAAHEIWEDDDMELLVTYSCVRYILEKTAL